MLTHTPKTSFHLVATSSSSNNRFSIRSLTGCPLEFLFRCGFSRAVESGKTPLPKVVSVDVLTKRANETLVFWSCELALF